jgi:hypothetical protein
MLPLDGIANQCPGWPDWSCQEVQVTDPQTLITSNQSFCKAGRRCVSDSDCLTGSFVSNFCLTSSPGLPALTTGICSLENQEEGTLVTLELPGVGVGVCVDDGDCPPQNLSFQLRPGRTGVVVPRLLRRDRDLFALRVAPSRRLL